MWSKSPRPWPGQTITENSNEETEILQCVCDTLWKVSDGQCTVLGSIVCCGGGINAGDDSKFSTEVQLCCRAGTAQYGGSGRAEDD